MNNLDPAQLAELEALMSAREKVLHEEVRVALEARADGPGVLGQQVDDAVAHGEERLRQGIEHAELQRDQEELRDIETARERIASGHYGECIDCGVEIGFERLKAQPTAVRCLACQTRYEQTHDAAPRYSS